MADTENPIHILVAEDDMLVAWAIRDILEGAGYRATVAHDGIQALAVEVMDPADLLLTDLNMPRLDGRGLIHRIRAGRPALPVLAMTGEANPMGLGDLGNGISAPTMVLEKPFTAHAILASLRALLNRE